MKDSTCIFCKIANGEIPSSTIYEDEDFRVFLDLGPAAKGHALIVPKEHYASIYELEDTLCSRVFLLAKKLALRMREVLHCDGINIMQNNGPVAGQTVFHFHLHLIPRYEGDSAGIRWNPGNVTPEELAELVEILRVE
ncbi:MAG: HIT family protein [Lachnospiraceae bacterium]|nr:HIT family protein [Lachnospiraceae bacterium]